MKRIQILDKEKLAKIAITAVAIGNESFFILFRIQVQIVLTSVKFCKNDSE